MPRQCGRKQRVEADQRAGGESGFRATTTFVTIPDQHAFRAAFGDAGRPDSESEVIASCDLILQAVRQAIAWDVALGCGREPGKLSGGLVETDVDGHRVVEPAARCDRDRRRAGGDWIRSELHEAPHEVGSQAGLVDSVDAGATAKADGTSSAIFSGSLLWRSDSRANSSK